MDINNFISSGPIAFFIPFAFFIGIIILLIILFTKMRAIYNYEVRISELERAVKEADDQAKLIIKTDLELNKAQEELDRRLSGLYTLNKISETLSRTLEQEEIFNRLNEPLISELGFQKLIIFTKKDALEYVCRVNVGYRQEQIADIKNGILRYSQIISSLDKKNILSSINKEMQETNMIISKIFDTSTFILSGIITKKGLEGFIFVGNDSKSFGIAEGEKELLSILSNEIGQSLENARLFEQTWKSQQELEVKVKQRTNELSKALEEINQISKRKTEFVSAVSHELRTPLTSIKGYTSIILAGALGELPDEIKTRLEKIGLHANELTDLINDMLDISRIESGKVKMKFSPCDIKLIINSVQDIFALQFKQKKIDFQIELPQQLNQIMMDNSQIQRVFINLLSNALKFTPEGGTIKIRTKDTEESILVEVSDSGIGIPPESISHIFEEFYRVENTINQNVKGTGLGLSLVKNIIEAHKGKIWVRSTPHIGTTFCFTLQKNIA